MSWITAARAWSALDDSPPEAPTGVRRAIGVVLLLAGGLIGLAWTAQLVPIALTGRVGPDYLDSPSAFWTIRIVDLGFIVPIALWTGVGLWKASRSAIKVACGGEFPDASGRIGPHHGRGDASATDPTASAALVYALAPITVALATLTVVLLRSYAAGISHGCLGPR